MKKLHLLAGLLSFSTLIPSASRACDFCMLGQGVSPYLTATGKGITLGINSMELDQVYDGSRRVDGHGKQENWVVYSATGFYPISEMLTLLVTVPYVSKTNIDFDEPTGLHPGTLTNGIGDLTATARYTLFKSHSLESTFIGGLLGGLKFPTGSTSNHDANGNAADRHALPGTGSWDFDLGFSGSYATAAGFQLTLDGVYRVSTRGKWDGRDHRYGNMMNYSMKAYQRAAKTEAGASFMPFVGVSGETTGRETGATDSGSGVYDRNLVNPSTGGTVLFADLGLYSVLNASTMVNLGFSKAFFRKMNFDPAFDADPAENYKIDLSLTYLY